MTGEILADAGEIITREKAHEIGMPAASTVL